MGRALILDNQGRSFTLRDPLNQLQPATSPYEEAHMAFIQEPSSAAVPVIGLFAPCDPRIDDQARERARNITVMTAKILKAISLPGGEKPGIYVANQTVERES